MATFCTKPNIRLLVLAGLTMGLAYGEEGKELDLCEVFNPAAFSNRHVSVRARMGFTMHGMYLLSNCKVAKPDMAVLYPGGRGAPPVGFELDPQATSRLAPFFRLTGGSAIACGVLNGTVTYKKHFRLHSAGAGPMGNGYGSRGALRWGFVIQSVVEIHACG